MWKILFLLTIGYSDPDLSIVNALKKEALEALTQGEYEVAAEKYSLLIDSLGVNEMPLKVNRAHAYFQSKQSKEAAVAYAEVFQTADMPHIRSMALNQMGLLASQNQETATDILQIFKSALKEDPYNDIARYNYQVIRRQLEHNKEENTENQDSQSESKDNPSQDQKSDQDQQKNEDSSQDQNQQGKEESSSENQDQSKEETSSSASDQEEESNEEKTSSSSSQQESEQKKENQQSAQENKDTSSSEEEKESENQTSDESSADSQEEEESQSSSSSEKKDQEKHSTSSSEQPSASHADPKDTTALSTQQKLQLMKLSTEKARMILEAMQQQEQQYLQQLRRQSTQDHSYDEKDW